MYYPHQDPNKHRVEYYRRIVAAYRGWRTWFSKTSGRKSGRQYSIFRRVQLLRAVSGLIDKEFAESLRSLYRAEGKLDVMLDEVMQYLQSDSIDTVALEKAKDIPAAMELCVLTWRCCRVLLLEKYDKRLHRHQVCIGQDLNQLISNVIA